MFRKLTWILTFLIIGLLFLTACEPEEVIPPTGSTPQIELTPVSPEMEATPDVMPTKAGVETPVTTPPEAGMETPAATPTVEVVEPPPATSETDELASQELIGMGEDVYERACASCHQPECPDLMVAWMMMK